MMSTKQLSVWVTSLSCIFMAACTEGEEPKNQATEPPEKKTENVLMDPKDPAVNLTAPAKFQAKIETSKGVVVIDVTREWSPNGADRFYNLAKNGFYDECRFFRVVAGFMAQIGINGNPEVHALWRNANIPDDPTKKSNLRGFVTFAKTGAPNSRSTQFFINYRDNSRLDGMGFAAFGQVSEGMEIVDSLYSGYGDGPPSGRGPNQGELVAKGNEYLKTHFSKLDFIKSISIIEEPSELSD